MSTDGSESVRGLSAKEDGLKVELDQEEVDAGQENSLSFRVLDGKDPVTDFDVEHERKMHLIVVRKDLTGFQHLHPKMDEEGTWSTSVEFAEGGDYRVFADFNHDGESLTLGSDLVVDGDADYQELPVQQTETETSSGYTVEVEGEAAAAGEESELSFHVALDGETVDVEPYLGADGHLVALREGDLAFLHVHPVGGSAGHEEHGAEHSESGSEGENGIRFMTEFPSEGRYRLFLQFQHEGDVHTAEFTREVTG